jgi:hypothetical protein
MSKPKNIAELRDQLCDVFDRVQRDSKFCALAHEASNAAGKIIGTISVELEYAALRKDTPNIDFLKTK